MKDRRKRDKSRERKSARVSTLETKRRSKNLTGVAVQDRGKAIPWCVSGCAQHSKTAPGCRRWETFSLKEVRARRVASLTTSEAAGSVFGQVAPHRDHVTSCVW